MKKKVHAQISMEKRHQSMAFFFRQLFAQAITHWTIILLFFSFVRSFLSLSLSFSSVCRAFDERKRKFWMLNALTRKGLCERRRRKKRTNEPASFCLYSSYSRRTNAARSFFSSSFVSFLANTIVRFHSCSLIGNGSYECIYRERGRKHSLFLSLDSTRRSINRMRERERVDKWY